MATPYGPNLPQLMNAAAQYNATTQDTENKLYDFQRKVHDVGSNEAAVKALGDYLNASTEQEKTDAAKRVRGESPETWYKSQERGLGFAQKAQDLQRKQYDLSVSKIDHWNDRLDYVLTRPENERPAAFAEAKQYAASIGVDTSQIPDEYDENYVRSLAAKSKDVRARMDSALEAGFEPGTPEWKKYMADVGVGKKSPLVSVNTPPAPGNLPVPTPTQGKVSGEMVSSLIDMSKLTQLQRMVDAGAAQKHLSGYGQLIGAGAKFWDKWGPFKIKVAERWRTNQVAFQRLAGSFADQAIHELSGAAVSTAEMERLKKEILNPDMGPTEFTEALRGLIDEVRRVYRIKFAVLQSGLPADPDRAVQEAQQKIDLYYQSTDREGNKLQFRDMSLAQQRFKYLLQKFGGNEKASDAALQQVINEGYISESKADMRALLGGR